MRKRSQPTRVMASLLIGLMSGLCVPLSADTLAPLQVSGVVFSAEDESALTGARVHLGQPGSERVFSSEATAEDGSFVIAELPPGIYEVSVESEGGLYLVPSPLQLDEGENQSINLSIHKTDAGAGVHGSLRRNAGIIDNPLFAALTLAGIATVVALLLDEMNNDKQEPEILPPPSLSSPS